MQGVHSQSKGHRDGFKVQNLALTEIVIGFVVLCCFYLSAKILTHRFVGLMTIRASALR